MTKYCKKSSIEPIAAEIKRKAGISQETPMPFTNITDEIDKLAIPTQRGNPSITLTPNNNTYTIQRGVYTGGSVSVRAYQGTASLKQSDDYFYPNGTNGDVFSSAIIPASNVFSIYSCRTGEDGAPAKPANNSTSFTVGNLSFKPVGIILTLINSHGYNTGNPYIGGFSWINGTVSGLAAGSSTDYGVPITSASVNTSQSNGKWSITISNIIATENNSNFTAKFCSYNLAVFVWGS